MRVQQSRLFERAVKKLHGNEKKRLDEAVRAIMADPEIGGMKRGDLAGVRVHKFSVRSEQALLAYVFEREAAVLTLLALGSHENFYRDVKRSLNR